MKDIILVEDDAAIRDVFSMVFDHDLYNITIYDTGQPILKNEATTPDLFVLDKGLPGSKGEDVCRFIKNSEQYKHVPVVMVSASADIFEVAAIAGADDVMAKPFSVKALRKMVAKHAYHFTFQ